MKKVKTTQGKTYVVTATTVPCRILSNGVELACAESVGQVSFVAIAEEVDVDQDDAIITPVFNVAPVGSSAKGGVKKFYIEFNDDGSCSLSNPHLLVDGTMALSFKSKILGEHFVFSKCTNAQSMFNTAGTVSGNLDVSFPVCKGFLNPFPYSLFRKLTVHAPLVVSAPSMASYGSRLVELVVDMPSLQYADTFAQYSSKLEVVTTDYPNLASGKNMFLYCGLSAETINKILGSLPTWSDGKEHVITFTGCPGAKTCDTSIATAKWWTVEI